MLIRISLIVAIIGGLAVAGLNFVTLKDKINTTIDQRDQNAHDRDTEKEAHRKFEKLAKDTQTTLDKTKTELAATAQERDTAVADRDAANKKYTDLSDVLKKTQQDLGTANDELAAWHALNITLKQARATIDSIRKLTEERDVVLDENKILLAHNAKLQNKLDELISPSPDGPPMPEGLTGKVLAVDPKYEFVVLNIGDKQGVKEYGQLLVSHAGKLVAKVKITGDIKDDKCVANVMPGWKFSDVMEGDTVLLPY